MNVKKLALASAVMAVIGYTGGASALPGTGGGAVDNASQIIFVSNLLNNRLDKFPRTKTPIKIDLYVDKSSAKPCYTKPILEFSEGIKLSSASDCPYIQKVVITPLIPKGGKVVVYSPASLSIDLEGEAVTQLTVSQAVKDGKDLAPVFDDSGQVTPGVMTVTKVLGVAK